MHIESFDEKAAQKITEKNEGFFWLIFSEYMETLSTSRIKASHYNVPTMRIEVNEMVDKN